MRSGFRVWSDGDGDNQGDRLQGAEETSVSC